MFKPVQDFVCQIVSRVIRVSAEEERSSCVRVRQH